ncbi:uncharacterized protein LOC144289894 isoform X2 [Canis aureus]
MSMCPCVGREREDLSSFQESHLFIHSAQGHALDYWARLSGETKGGAELPGFCHRPLHTASQGLEDVEMSFSGLSICTRIFLSWNFCLPRQDATQLSPLLPPGSQDVVPEHRHPVQRNANAFKHMARQPPGGMRKMAPKIPVL